MCRPSLPSHHHFLLVRGAIVNKSSRPADERARGGAFSSARQRSNRRSTGSAPADDGRGVAEGTPAHYNVPPRDPSVPARIASVDHHLLYPRALRLRRGRKLTRRQHHD